MFLTRLPSDALVFTTPAVREMLRESKSWTLEHELLAQIKEEVSILASEHRRKKPVQIPRPDHVRSKGRRRDPVRVGEPPSPEGIARAIGVLKQNAKRVHMG